jgi:hypothetical protein
LFIEEAIAWFEGLGSKLGLGLGLRLGLGLEIGLGIGLRSISSTTTSSLEAVRSRKGPLSSLFWPNRWGLGFGLGSRNVLLSSLFRPSLKSLYGKSPLPINFKDSSISLHSGDDDDDVDLIDNDDGAGSDDDDDDDDDDGSDDGSEGGDFDKRDWRIGGEACRFGSDITSGLESDSKLGLGLGLESGLTLELGLESSLRLGWGLESDLRL